MPASILSELILYGWPLNALPAEIWFRVYLMLGAPKSQESPMFRCMKQPQSDSMIWVAQIREYPEIHNILIGALTLEYNESCSEAYINIFVDPKFQDEGVGTKLLKLALSWLSCSSNPLVAYLHPEAYPMARKFGAKQEYDGDTYIPWVAIRCMVD